MKTINQLLNAVAARIAVASQIARALLLAGGLAGVSVVAWSETSVCLPKSDQYYLDFRYSQLDTASVEDVPDAELEGLRYQWQAMVFGNPPSGSTPDFWRAGLTHDYLPLDFQRWGALEPQTNGDLHALSLPMSWFSSSSTARGRWRLSVAPAISVSSNTLKNPEKINGDSVQWWFGSVHQQRLSGELERVLGLCADHRFGHFQGYPVVGLLWRPSERVRLRLAYPDSSIHYRVSERLNLDLSIGPEGHQWHVLNQSLKQRSEVFREVWQLEGRVSWSLSRSLVVSFVFGRSFDQQLKFTTRSNQTLAIDVDDENYTGLGFRWYFAEKPFH